jgi:phytanoyl-CoA hydroxylase
MSLTAAEKNHFDQQGYLVKEHIYNADDLRPIQDALSAIVDAGANELHAAGQLDNLHADASFEHRLAHLHQDNPEAAQTITQGIIGGRFNGPAMLGLLRHPPLLSCITSLVGPDIIGSSVYRIRPKLPDWTRGEVPWHQDSGYFLAHCDTDLIVTCWLALTDSTLANGCLYVLPGLHRRGVLRHYTGGHAGFLEIAGEDLPPVEPVALEMQAGSVLFMTNLTPHSSYKNNTDTVRWSVDLRYQNMDVPNNIDEAPQSYTPERDPVTMACYPPEADFVLRDTQHPEREVHSPKQFHRIREAYVEHRTHMPGRGWKPMPERGTTP